MIVLLVLLGLIVNCVSVFYTWRLQQAFDEFETDMNMILFDDEKTEENEK